MVSHGLNIFPAVRSYLKDAGEDSIEPKALTDLLFREFDTIVGKNDALRGSEYWQGMLDAADNIRKRNNLDDAGLILLAYMDGFLQETLARAYPKDGQFEDPAYEATWKKLFLDMDSLLVRKEGRYTVVSGAPNEDMETFMNMKMVEHLTAVGRADFAEKLLLDTASSINNEEFSGTLGSTMFVEAVARYLTRKDLTPQELRSLSPVLTRQQLLNRENREFLLSRYGNTPSIVDAVKKVMKDYEKKGTLTVGEQGYYRNASKIMVRLIVNLASDDGELTKYAPLARNITAKTENAIGNWKETMQPDISIEDSIKNHLFASLTLSHNGDMLSDRNLKPMMPRLNPGNMRAALFLSSELQMVKIPGIIKKNLPPVKTNNEIRMALQPLLSVHERYGTIPLTLSENGENNEPDKPADPVTTAGILEILQVRAERKMKDVVIKAFNVSIEANKAILYAS